MDSFISYCTSTDDTYQRQFVHIGKIIIDQSAHIRKTTH